MNSHDIGHFENPFGLLRFRGILGLGRRGAGGGRISVGRTGQPDATWARFIRIVRSRRQALLEGEYIHDDVTACLPNKIFTRRLVYKRIMTVCLHLAIILC